jgi:hypothetical protein
MRDCDPRSTIIVGGRHIGVVSNWSVYRPRIKRSHPILVLLHLLPLLLLVLIDLSGVVHVLIESLFDVLRARSRHGGQKRGHGDEARMSLRMMRSPS